MNVLFWMFGGVLGGAVGAAIWIAVALATGYEVGWIAWGVGMTTGIGLRYFAYLKDIDESFEQGLVAGIIAAAAIVGAKYVVFRKFINDVSQITPEEVEFVPPKFSEFFGLFDALWFGLAVITAYKIGEGSHESD